MCGNKTWNIDAHVSLPVAARSGGPDTGTTEYALGSRSTPFDARSKLDSDRRTHAPLPAAYCHDLFFTRVIPKRYETRPDVLLINIYVAHFTIGTIK